MAETTTTNPGLGSHVAEDKENVDVNGHGLKSPAHHKPPVPMSSSQKSVGRDARDCPQTPVGRLPLSQLLANNEDSRLNMLATPMERVLWENSSLSSDPTTANTSKKKRKRASSVSPISSTQNEGATPSIGKKGFEDPQSLQEPLRTPRVDPADDLWNRLSLHAWNTDSPNLGDLQFPNLMHSSSPQTPAPHLPRDASLRRAISCIEWPTSAAKRRKLHHHGGARKSAATFAEPSGADENNKGSVSLMIEKMHSGLSKSKKSPILASPDPSRSSPTLGRSIPPNKNLGLSESDGRDSGQRPAPRSPPALDKVPGPKPPAADPAVAGHPQQYDGSFDYGDDEFDEHMADVADLEAHTTSPSLCFPRPGSGGRQDDGSGLAQQALKDGRNLSSQTEQKTPSKGGEDPQHLVCNDLSDNEFDDGADDFAADLEEVFAKYESQQPMQQAGSTDENKKSNADLSNDSEPSACIEQIPVEIVSSDDEDFGDDSDFEHLAAECVEATQGQGSEASVHGISDRKPAFLERYIVKDIADGHYQGRTHASEPEKILSVQSERSKLLRVIVLRGMWTETPCEAGACVHVVGEFDRLGQCIVDNLHNLIILHPDHLISSTVVGDSFTCIRKSVLQERVKTTSDTSQGLVYGHIIHEIFQESLRENRWDEDSMETLIQKMVVKHLEALFEINIEPAVAVEQLKSRTTDLQAWAEIFVAAKPTSNAVVKDRNGAQALMSINKLLEVEEHVWAPTFGLKGNIDATVQIHLEEESGQKTLTVPFELKTGKIANAAHKAQTSLYSLLLSDRYDIDVTCGILYYMQSSEISTIRTIRHELVPMIVQRNQIAHYVRNRKTLPPMLRNPRTCGNCYAKIPCFTYHKLVDHGNGETSGMGEKFNDLVRHLNAEHQHFFRRWDELLTKEEADVVKTKKELWTMQSAEREKLGRCFGGLIVEPGSFQMSGDTSKINRFTYSLTKRNPSPGFTFAESELSIGEPVVVSDEDGHFALANGYVSGVRKRHIQVSVDRRLHNARSKMKGFHPEKNQVFSGIMELTDKGGIQSTATPKELEESVTYRLDKDEFSNGMALIRNNLIRLMEKDVFGVQALRRLIVEGVAPTFKPSPTGYTLGDTASQANLNVDQHAAIEKVMSAKDYALVLGMPGTGKTTTIAHIIRALVAQGKTVLLTSYTHTAVDNILLKLRADNIGIFRLGAIAKVHSEVQKFADLAGRPMSSTDEIKRCYTRQVIATTCLGINHPIFNQRIFDYCIVDEASQITLPVCLGPIRMARTFILVGDHFQLPPLVANKEAQEGGLDISLFKTLSEKHPDSVVNLEHQYRMCEDIMTLSNTLIYNGHLKCGTQSVARRSLVVPKIDELGQHHYKNQSLTARAAGKVCVGPIQSSCWIRDLIEHSLKACFVNTDLMAPFSREVLEAGSRITNPCEVLVINQLVQALLTVGILPTEIGVITLYRSQLALLKRSMRHTPEIEMHTADRFQGRDKEIILLSMVRSNEQQTVGDLLKDRRRVNVALTRARTKLLIVGSKKTLIGNELLKDLVDLMEAKSWCYDLPAHAHEGHVFEEADTQVPTGASLGIASLADKSPSSKIEEAIDDKENAFGKKVAAKQSRLDMNVLTRKRPVLRDIVNDSM